jgi:hypothetical protein
VKGKPNSATKFKIRKEMKKMTNDEAYAAIAKHTFVAYRKYEGDKQIIVFATNIDEAEYIAKKVFDTSSVFVKPISSTANPQVFEV